MKHFSIILVISLCVIGPSVIWFFNGLNTDIKSKEPIVPTVTVTAEGDTTYIYNRSMAVE